MRRWKKGVSAYGKSDAVDSFLNDIAIVCKQHGMSISHEDSQGAFIVEKFSDDKADWLADAHIGKSIE